MLLMQLAFCTVKMAPHVGCRLWLHEINLYYGHALACNGERASSKSFHLRPNPPVSLIASSSLARIVSMLSYGGSIIWLKHVATCRQARIEPKTPRC